ncbi:MAG: TMEM175 family protein [Candidatus Peribacteraceae bacterium]
MHTTRLEAFSDGVIAIIITIMVLELHAPEAATLEALRPLFPMFLAYVMSFIYLGIYWNNHHHLFHATDHLDGRVLWANLHLLFWLSLVPFSTAWLSETHFAAVPTALYGALLLCSGVAYFLLVRAIVAHSDSNHDVREAIGSDYKGKLSIFLYVLGVIVSFWDERVAIGIYALVALMWLLPDQRIEKKLGHRH